MSVQLCAAPLEQTVVRKGARARVLILSDGAPRGFASEIQRRFDDETNVWIPSEKSRLKGGSTALTKYLGVRPWDVLFIDPDFRNLYKHYEGVTDADKRDAFVREARAHALVCVLPEKYAKGERESIYSCIDFNSAEALCDALQRALYGRTPPHAPWPQNGKNPARLLMHDGALDNPKTLPLLPCREAIVYRAREGGEQFNMHPFLAHFDGKYWALWSSGSIDEDSKGQFLRFATSKDGLCWSEPKTLIAEPEGENALRPWSWMPGGLFIEGGKLMAYGALSYGSKLNVYPKKIWVDLKTFRFEWVGTHWENRGVFLEDGLFYFPPWPIGDGRKVAVLRDTYARFFTARTFPNSDTFEQRRLLPTPLPEYRMSETSAYVDSEGIIHLIIRDQGGTGRLYHSISTDNGATWTLPVKTNYPDAMSKNMSGRLSDGRFYIINNPNTRERRDPLSITFSKDGWSFSHAANLRVDAPARRFPGKFKNEYSFQYSHAIEHDGRLWVIYSINKEDIGIVSVALEDLPKD